MTTSLAYEELLAFEGLQDAVDQLYRAYLDATIVQAKREYKANSDAYWKGIREIRKSELDPGTPNQYPKKAEQRELDAQADKDIAEKRNQSADRSAFLYWFDVRAKFWSSVADTSLALEEFPYADELELLKAQANVLKIRVERLSKVLKNREGARPAAFDSSALDKLSRQAENAGRFNALIVQVTSADANRLAQLMLQAQPKPAHADQNPQAVQNAQADQNAPPDPNAPPDQNPQGGG